MATGLGRDTSCTTSLRVGRMVSGGRLLAEAAYRRLTTARGLLYGGDEEAHYGIDLTEEIGNAYDAAAAAALPGKIRNELMKDDRIARVDVQVSEAKEGPAAYLTVTISGEAHTGDTFGLTLGVSEVSADILGMEGTS